MSKWIFDRTAQRKGNSHLPVIARKISAFAVLGTYDYVQ